MSAQDKQRKIKQIKTKIDEEKQRKKQRRKTRIDQERRGIV
ncbi:MAG: hypothetical protein AAB785_02645 [Patescibacteria group bacterium]